MGVKLSQQQVTALTEKIYREIEAVAKVANKIVDRQEKELVKRLLENHPDFKALIASSSYTEAYVTTYLKENYKTEFRALPKRVRDGYNIKEEVKNDIIIRTIDAENVEALISAVKEQFLPTT